MNLKLVLENIEKSKEFAEKAHAGVNRKFSGEPYVEHPKRVAEIVKLYKKDSHALGHLISASHLHDTIEDTNTTVEDLKELFHGLVVSLVQELTSDKEKIKEMGKTEYLSHKMINMSSWALVIKLADRLDNVSDLKTSSPKFREKYVPETKTILNNLKKGRKLTNTQVRLVDAIETKLKELENE